MKLPLINSLGLVPDACTSGPPAPRPLYQSNDRDHWLLDRVWYASWFRPLQARYIVQRLRTRWPVGEYAAWRDEYLVDLIADLDIQLVPGLYSPHWDLLVRHCTGDHVSRDHVRYRIGLGGPPLPVGPTEGERPKLVWPSTNLKADVSPMRRVRQRLDQQARRPYPPRGTKPNLVIAADLSRLGYPAIRLDQLRDLSRLAWEAVELHWDLLDRCIYDTAGYIDFIALSSQSAVSLTRVELPYDRYRDDAAAVVRWLGPAVVDACNGRRVTRARAMRLSPIRNVKHGASGKVASGVEIALYAGIDEDGDVTLVRAEPRLTGRGGKRSSIRRLLRDPEALPANLLDEPGQIEERLAPIASAGFDVVLDGQARWIPPDRLGPAAITPAGPVAKPVTVELTGLLAQLSMLVVPRDSMSTAEGLRQLAETGWCQRGLLPADVVARGVSRGLLRSPRRSDGIELAGRWQLTRLAVRTVLTAPAVRPGGLHPPIDPPWARRIEPVVDYLVRLAWLVRETVAGRRAVVRAITTLLADGYASESVLRPILPGLLEPAVPSVAPDGPVLVPAVQALGEGAMYGPARKRGERYQLALSIEQRVRWLRAWRPDLDVAVAERALKPYIRAMAAARSAERPQVAKVEAAMQAVRQARDGASVAEMGRAAQLNRRPEVVGKYVGAGLLIASLPDSLGDTAAKLRWARR